jgi:hypothetical protein
VFLVTMAAELLRKLLPLGYAASGSAATLVDKGYRYLLEQLNSTHMCDRLQQLQDGSCRLGDTHARHEDLVAARSAIAALRKAASNMRAYTIAMEEVL